MVDGWTDKKRRTLLNFLVNCPKGTMFVESIDASSHSKNAEKMFQLIDKFVERIGEVNVVQIVTDSAAANVLASLRIFFLEKKLLVSNIKRISYLKLFFFSLSWFGSNRKVCGGKVSKLVLDTMCCPLLGLDVGRHF